MQFFSYVGRQSELEKFDRALKSNSLVLLLGKSGVGKTTFFT